MEEGVFEGADSACNEEGDLVANKHLGEAFGPSSLLVPGGALYVSNIYGWLLAMPSSEILSGEKAAITPPEPR